MGLLLWTCIDKTVYTVDWLSDKEKVPGGAVGKEDHDHSFLRHDKTHRYWFP